MWVDIYTEMLPEGNGKGQETPPQDVALVFIQFVTTHITEGN